MPSVSHSSHHLTMTSHIAIVISYEYVYVSEGRYDSFHHLALYNLVLGLMRVILLKSKKFKWWMTYISSSYLYILFTALQVYKARFYNILGHEVIACSRYVEFIAAMLKFQMSTVNLKTWILSMLLCVMYEYWNVVSFIFIHPANCIWHIW